MEFNPPKVLAWMPYFTTTVNTSSIMGTKFYFLLVLPLSEDDIIPLPAPPMSAAAASPGMQPAPAQPSPPAPGKTWPNSRLELLGHPPTNFWVLMHASPQPPAARSTTLCVYGYMICYMINLKPKATWRWEKADTKAAPWRSQSKCLWGTGRIPGSKSPFSF